jgi:hypothetical protein
LPFSALPLAWNDRTPPFCDIHSVVMNDCFASNRQIFWVRKAVIFVGRSHDRAFEVEWDAFSRSADQAAHTNKIRIEGATGAPGGGRAAVAGEVKTLLGLRVRQVGFIIDVSTATVHGRVRTGKRNTNGWTVDN